MEAKCVSLEYFLYFFFSRAKGFCFIMCYFGNVPPISEISKGY